MRLSKDDDKLNESTSIENQRTILTKFVLQKGGVIIGEYIDDGWTGTNFNRPEVQRLLNDAKQNLIDTIVVKDLSRFGRNYIQVGQYIDYIFPAYKIRFIAISDNIDTFDRQSAAMDMMPIMNVFNEWHAANTSKKIRAVLQANQRAGKYTGWGYPYGYKAGCDKLRTAQIDDESAQVVKKIFSLRLQGNSYGNIARILTDEKVQTPSQYFTRMDGKKSNKKTSPLWCAKTIKTILSDLTYTGCTIQHRTSGISYKNKTQKILPSEERIIKQNSHPPIIDEEIFKSVQSMNKSIAVGRVDKNNFLHPLSGFLICSRCQKKLKSKTYKSKNSTYFICRTYSTFGKKYCTSHLISESIIHKIILADINSMLKEVTLDKEQIIQRFKTKRQKQINSLREQHEKKSTTLKNRISELDRLTQSLYEERILNDYPFELTKTLLLKYTLERQTLTAQLQQLAPVPDMDISDEAETYFTQFQSFFLNPVIDRQFINTLIEKIIIYSSPDALTIYYNFAP